MNVLTIRGPLLFQQNFDVKFFFLKSYWDFYLNYIESIVVFGEIDIFMKASF